MPLKQLFKRSSVANLKQLPEEGYNNSTGGGGGSNAAAAPPTTAQAQAQAKVLPADTSYHSSFPKKISPSNIFLSTNQQQQQQQNSGVTDNSSSNYSSSPQSTVDYSFLPRIEIQEDEGGFMSMDFMKKEAPLPPLPGKSPEDNKATTQYLNTQFATTNSEDDDDDNNSIQASPVVFEPEKKVSEQHYQSSSSTLPSHFSNNSSASSSTTVDSVNNTNNTIIIKNTHQASNSKHSHSYSATSYNNPADAETARQFWSYHQAQHGAHGSITSYAGAAGVEKQDQQDDDDDEPLFEEKVEPKSSRVKSMFPSLSFYKPIKNPDDDYKKEQVVEEGEDESLVSPSESKLYDGGNNLNDSVLSFNESKTEKELERNSLPPVDTTGAANSASSFRRSLASPVKSLKGLTKRSSRTFSKKLVFNEHDEEHSPPPLPAVSVDETAFGDTFGSDDSLDSPDLEKENAPPLPSKAPPPAPLPPHLTTRHHGEEESDEEDDEEDNLLPLSPLAPPTRSGVVSSLPNSNSMVMTKSQFDSYRKSVIESGLTSPMNRNKRRGDNDDDDDDDDDDDEYGDDEDDDDDDSESEKPRDKYDDEEDSKKQQIRMRLKQDAHLSVYRQKMTKVTGSQTALSSYNSGLRGSQSFGNLDAMMMEDDDDDEYDDVPLGILQAHGFPGSNGGRLKTMASQPNMNVELATGQPGPGILYQGGRPAETQSLRSANSNSNLKPGVDIRASAPLPAVFNNPNGQMNRGLIGEIAIAEQEKQKRKSMAGMAGMAGQSGMLNQRASTILPSSQSMYGGGSNDAMQQQMQQMMQMQMQILQQMSNGSTNNATTSPPQMKKHWSSFDIQQQTSNFQPPYGRPSSIRSFSPSERSFNSANRGMRTSQPAPGHHQRNNSQPTLKELASQEMYRMSRSQSTPYMYQQQPQQQPIGMPPPPHSSRPPSMMKIVQEPESDDDDDDDQAWEEMLKKRQGLKDSWKNRGITA